MAEKIWVQVVLLIYLLINSNSMTLGKSLLSAPGNSISWRGAANLHQWRAIPHCVTFLDDIIVSSFK